MPIVGSDAPLDVLLAHLRDVFGGAVHVQFASEERVDLRLGTSDDAVITVRCTDPSRPSYHVAYPAVAVKRDGSRYVLEQAVDGVLRDGIVWIARQLLENGFVKPELAD